MRIAGIRVPAWAVAVVGLLIVSAVAMAVAGSKGNDKAAEQSPDGTTQGQSVVTSSQGTSEISTSTAGKATTPGESSPDGGSTDGEAPASDATNDGSDPDEGTDPKDGTGTVVVKFWNDSSSKSNDLEVRIGDAEWAPGRGTSNATKLGPIPLSKTVDLTVYPEGEDGGSFIVPIVVTAAMSGLDRDAIHVELRDAEVRVLGNPVVGFEVIEPRG